MSGLLVLRDPDALPALVVCPTHLPRQWERELAKTLPWLRRTSSGPASPYDPAKRREMKGYDPDVLIINYHKLRGWVDHLAGRVRTVIFDEAQELRRADSDKYKAAARRSPTAPTSASWADRDAGLQLRRRDPQHLSVLAPDALGSARSSPASGAAARLLARQAAVKRPEGARHLPARRGPDAAPHPQGRRPRAARGRPRPAPRRRRRDGRRS
jgi:hypothetical protein